MQNHSLRMMIFIDGSNLLIELGKELDLHFRADRHLHSAIELASILIRQLYQFNTNLDLIRTYWFSSYSGNEETENEIKNVLRQKGFEPIIFRKRNGREKGVDIALTKEMLVNAFNDNFDIGYLVAGDEDYSELVLEAKRYGARIFGYFFEKHGLSEKLRLSLDGFRPIQLNLGTDNIGKIIENLRIEAKSNNEKKQ